MREVTGGGDRSLFHEPILLSACQHDHRVHQQMYRPEMQIGKPSKAFWHIPSVVCHFLIQVLSSLLPLLPSSPIRLEKHPRTQDIQSKGYMLFQVSIYMYQDSGY